jgi:hypothetical protein
MALQTSSYELKINFPLLQEQADFLLALSENQLAFYPEACEVISGVLGLLDTLEAQAVENPEVNLVSDNRTEVLELMLDVNGVGYEPVVQRTHDGRIFIDSEIHWAAFSTAEVGLRSWSKETREWVHMGFIVSRDTTRGATPSSIILWPIVEAAVNAPKIDEED